VAGRLAIRSLVFSGLTADGEATAQRSICNIRCVADTEGDGGPGEFESEFRSEVLFDDTPTIRRFCPIPPIGRSFC
jgi:hypothetical protein